MSRVLPILFNTDMVRAILDGRKTVTRRVVKAPPHPDMPDNHNYCRMPLWMRIGKNEYGFRDLHYMDVIEQNPFKQTRYFDSLTPFDKGDILYVRETWNYGYIETSDSAGNFEAWFEQLCPGEEYGSYIEALSGYFYKADEDAPGSDIKMVWRPSIHMPKEAARIWLKVTDVRVERLQDMGVLDCQREGIDISQNAIFKRFSILWDSTVKEKDIYRYGWKSNPWVWVIEFERCERPEVS